MCNYLYKTWFVFIFLTLEYVSVGCINISVYKIKLYVSGLDTNGCPIAKGSRFQVGASKKLQTVATWAIASICSILNFNDCHNRNRMSVASRANDKLGGGQVPSGKKV